MDHVVRNAHLIRAVDADSRGVPVVERAFAHLRRVGPGRFNGQRVSRVRIVIVALLPGAVKLDVREPALG